MYNMLKKARSPYRTERDPILATGFLHFKILKEEMKMKKTAFLVVLLLAVFSVCVFATTPTPTPTITTSGKVFFQATPGPGKITLVPAVAPLQPSRKITTINIDYLADTVTANGINIIKLYDGFVLLRQILITDDKFPQVIDMFGIQANSFAVDYGKNTGTSTTVTQ